MFIRVNSEVFQKKSNLVLGVVVAEGIDNKTENEKVVSTLANATSQQRRLLAGQTIKDIAEFQIYHEAMKVFGINPSRNLMSVESLLNRIVRGKGIPQINPVVDLANAISIQYKVPLGAHDIDTLNGDIEVRLAKDSDLFDASDEAFGNAFDTDEVVYASGNTVRTRRWIWRQMPIGRIGEEANRVVFPIDGFVENVDTIIAARDALAYHLRQFFGCKVRVGLIQKNTPCFKMTDLTEEDLRVEETIKIMLNGSISHSDEGEMAEKIMQAYKENRPLRIKFGLDPSAPDVHLGHAVPLRKIKQLQDLGHQAIIIMGDFTGMIGDPSGKSKTRKPLSHEEVLKNAKTYEDQIFTILDRSKTTVLFNSSWLSKLNFKDVIELAAKTTVARLLERDDFSNRYKNEQPISLHEFFYPLMQAYDSVAINADVEIGGSDQTFNIFMGRNLQRDYGQLPQIALFFPLLVGYDGVEKMSKSLNNYIGINEHPNIMYEKVMKIPDQQIITYYSLCTDVHPDEIGTIKVRMSSGENPRDIKTELAKEIVTLYYSPEEAIKAEKYFVDAYQKQQAPIEAPRLPFNKNDGDTLGFALIVALEKFGVAKTRSEVRRLFKQGAIRLNGERVINPNEIMSISTGDILQVGKGKFFTIVKSDGE